MKKYISNIVFATYFSIITTLLLSCCTAHAQNEQVWEFGVGLSPMIVNKQDPWMIVIRNNFSKVFSLRMGAGMLYHNGQQKNRDYSPLFEPNIERYEYNSISKTMKTSLFAGLQYGKKIKATYVYAFSDLLFSYKQDDDQIDKDGIKYFSTNIPRYSDVSTVTTHKYRINTWAARQGIGLKFFFTQQIAMSIEGNITYEIENFAQEKGYFWFKFYGDDPLITSGYTYFAKVKDKNRHLYATPIGLITISYHF